MLAEERLESSQIALPKPIQDVDRFVPHPLVLFRLARNISPAASQKSSTNRSCLPAIADEKSGAFMPWRKAWDPTGNMRAKDGIVDGERFSQGWFFVNQNKEVRREPGA
jgi:hypothetical protein